MFKGTLFSSNSFIKKKLQSNFEWFSMIEKGRKDINTALPKQPRGSNRSPRYSLNWESFSDYPLVFLRPFSFLMIVL